MNNTLNGLRILNTRPVKQAQGWAQEIIQAGGINIDCPALEIRPKEHDWYNSLPSFDEVHTAVFISANAVHLCFEYLKEHHIKWPDHIKVVAVGDASASALTRYHVDVDFVPKIADSEHLLTLNALHHLTGKTVLLFKGMGGRPLIKEVLTQRGALVIPVNLYERVMPQYSPNTIQNIWHNDLVDIILITSEHSLHNLFQMFGEDAHPWLQSKPFIVISKRLAQSASLLGIKNSVVTHPHRMIQTLIEFSKGLLHG